MDERRQSLQPQFDRLFDKMSENHEETIQRLTKIETSQLNDRKDLDDLTTSLVTLKTQCDGHDKVVDRGKWVFGLISAVGIGTVWQYAKTALHIGEKAAK